MSIKPTTEDAYRLFHEGSLALAEVEQRGMRIDVGRLESTIADTNEKIKRITEELKNDEVWKFWKRRFGERTNLGSRPQLAKVLLNDMKINTLAVTRGGRTAMDEEALESVGIPFTSKYLVMQKLMKLKSTYLSGLKREVIDGYVHPVYNLHLVETFRSSADSPNIQNQIVRDPETAQLIRSCFIPREGHVLSECDYGALEFRGCACFWKDQNMIKYASDPTLDIHRDTAMEIYMLTKDEVTKNARYCGKNQFVFPQLYGSDYINCCANLWNSIHSMNLTTKAGVPLMDHLRSHGITKLGRRDRNIDPEDGTFEGHVLKVQNRYHSKFPQWSDRRDQWIYRYRERGYFDMMTGFRCSGVYSRNALFNYPVQGPCFHLLLWSLIQLNKELKKRRMKTMIIGEIHDSILADVHESEIDDYFGLANEIMTQWTRRHWDWVVTPLIMEPEICTPTWWSKSAYKLSV